MNIEKFAEKVKEKLSSRRKAVVDWMFDSDGFTESEIFRVLEMLAAGNFVWVASWLYSRGYAERSDMVWEG